ncbi:ABC transporter ATP-binding protein [Lutispora sp.]|uniref:ABC transporter ATP-binding protein n=1 Tax=Lutispora sp. TaxID=2828727 RepID=UPI002B2039C9|nr:sn-glycerol-3-phosphate ABC transporter ATP-binding protein UgpC [Lutispora sp.]MEA4960384.1 sn-glycerol-3-phosphate ABC transporter ATP-binding protein UgpC [Lutispora sp.]
MSKIVLKNINKIYENGFHAVKDLSLSIDSQEFVVLVGPSGCGKTTTLRMIAGLEEITRGELYMDDKLMNHVESKDRDIAMVFQNHALYPHMSVFDNMAFGLKMRKVNKKVIYDKVTETAKSLGIDSMLTRKPHELSGGQKQRVALGRAIVRNPKIFLMDEPLSNLDAKLRVQMRTEIVKLYHRLNTTFIYVTHDQTEAMTMGTKIVVMNEGYIQQVADPQTIYDKPANVFVASTIGSPQMNFIDARVSAEDGYAYFKFGDFKVKASADTSEALLKSGYKDKEVIIGIRPENIRVAEEKNREALSLRLELMEILGSENLFYLELMGGSLVVKADSRHKAYIGSYMDLCFDAEKIHVFDKDTKDSVIC